MYYTDDLSGDAVPPEDDWKPTHWTAMKSKATLGDEIADFIEKYHTPPRGDQTKLIEVKAWQRWLLRHIFELDAFGLFRYKEVYIQVPRKQGKSMIASGIGNYFLVKGKPGDRIYFAAKKLAQSKIIYNEARRNLVASPELSSVTRALQQKATNTFKDIQMEALASTNEAAQGFAPYISICDELHTWDAQTSQSTKGKDMLESLVTGSGDQDEHMVIEITTAGSNLDGLAYERYDRGKRIAQGAIEDDSFGFFCWEAEEHDDINDPKTLMKANPGIAGGYISLETMQKELATAMQTDTSAFERYQLNRWLRRGNNQEFLAGFHWDEIKNPDHIDLFEQIKLNDAMGRPIKPRIVMGFDGSLSEDSTGIIGMDLATNTLQVLYSWEKDPRDPNWRVDLDDLDEKFRKCFELFDVAKVYADPSHHRDFMARWQLSFGRLIVRDIPPTPARMAPLSSDFKNDVAQKKIRHDGNRRFREHVVNAVENVKGLPMKETKYSPRKIDFLVCAILANAARQEVEAQDAALKSQDAFYNAF